MRCLAWALTALAVADILAPANASNERRFVYKNMSNVLRAKYIWISATGIFWIDRPEDVHLRANDLGSLQRFQGRNQIASDRMPILFSKAPKEKWFVRAYECSSKQNGIAIETSCMMDGRKFWSRYEPKRGLTALSMFCDSHTIEICSFELIGKHGLKIDK